MNCIPKWMGIQQTLSSCFMREGMWVKACSVYDFNGWSHERIKNVLRQRRPVKRDPKREPKIQICHNWIVSRFLRGFCSFSHKSYLGKIVIWKLVQQQWRACSVFAPCRKISGSDLLPVSEGREHGQKDKSLKGGLLSDCALLTQVGAETRSICGRL